MLSLSNHAYFRIFGSVDNMIRQTQPFWLNSGTHYFCTKKLDMNKSYGAASRKVYNQSFLCCLERHAQYTVC